MHKQLSKSFQVIYSSLRNLSNSINLQGVLPPIPTIYDDQEQLNIDAMKSNLKQYKNLNFAGLVLFGTNGEHAMLDEGEKVFIVQELIKEKLHIPIIVGVRGESTKEAISECKALNGIGVNAVLVGPPSIFRGSISERNLINHYFTLADASHYPVVVYNMPSIFGTDMSADMVISMSQHENIIGYKESSGDVVKMARIVDETRNRSFQVLAGGAGFFLPALISGCSGGICALANVLGNEMIQLHDLIKKDKISEAVSLQAKMIQPNFLITRKYGVPGLKYAMELFGYHGGICRAPISPIVESAKLDIRKSFESNGFL